MSADAERIIGLCRSRAHAGLAARASQRATRRPMEAGWLHRFLGLLPAQPSVLDLGCGSGEPIGNHLIEQGCELTGVDSAPEMIAICKARLSAQAWRVADMQSLALRQVFDGLVAWDSFFHLCPDDQRRMFPVRSHAGARAALIFTSGPDEAVAMGSFEGEPLYHASLDAAEYRALLAENCFDVITHAAEDPACGRRTIWRTQLR